MENNIKNNELIIKLPERITYDTSLSFDNDLFDIVKNNDFESIILDASDLVMISSAGLRVILKLSKEYKNMSIINVKSEAYEVFAMTGFIDIMNIKKAYREISIENAKLIGDGFFSKVYKVSNDSIVKVFVNPSTTLTMIEKELNLAKQAFILGVPTAISFDIVRVGDYYGVIFEMLNAGLLRDVFKENPDKFEKLIKEYAILVKKITTTKVSDTSVPYQIDVYNKDITYFKDYVEQKDFERIKYLLSTIKETNTFLHNDCHVKNIMVSNNELFLIDMETFSQGNPIFELAGIAESGLVFTDYNPENQRKFFNLDPEFVYKIYYAVTREYFIDLSDKAYQSNMKKIRTLAYIGNLAWIKKYAKDNKDFFNFSYNEVKKLIYEVEDFNLIF